MWHFLIFEGSDEMAMVAASIVQTNIFNQSVSFKKASDSSDEKVFKMEFCGICCRCSRDRLEWGHISYSVSQ